MAYAAIVTTAGQAKLAESAATGIPLVFTEFAVGDGVNPLDPAATALVNERWRGSVNATDVDPTAANRVRVEGLIPAASGGWYIREAGVFSADGTLVAVAQYPETYKPTPAEGATVDEYIRLLVAYAAGESIALSVDGSVIMATRDYVDPRATAGLYLWEHFA